MACAATQCANGARGAGRAAARAEQDRNPYQLVIVDIDSLDDHGTGLARQAAADAVHRRRYACLVLDGYGMPATDNLLGGDAYLDKPLRLARLMEAVRPPADRAARRAAAAASRSRGRASRRRPPRSFACWWRKTIAPTRWSPPACWR